MRVSKSGEPDAPVGEARPALVEADQPGERLEPLEEACVARELPSDLEVREEPGHQHEVEGTFPGDLVRDVDVAATARTGSRCSCAARIAPGGRAGFARAEGPAGEP